MVERDANGDPLNDLGEIAGRVLWWNYAEDGARRGSEAQDVAMKDMTRERIGDDRCRLSGLHLRELIFLEIRIDL